MFSCNLCKREMNTSDPLSNDCGGDCWGCISEIEADFVSLPADTYRRDRHTLDMHTLNSYRFKPREYSHGGNEPIVPCPYCASPCEADFVDVGVGFTQCGPYHCQICNATQIGAYDNYYDPYKMLPPSKGTSNEHMRPPRVLELHEVKTGWYAPQTLPGSSANMIHGEVVRYKDMEQEYREQFVGNPEWHDNQRVDDWWKEIRE